MIDSEREEHRFSVKHCLETRALRNKKRLVGKKSGVGPKGITLLEFVGLQGEQFLTFL